MFCKVCGKEVDGQALFCADCGSQVSDTIGVKAFVGDIVAGVFSLILTATFLYMAFVAQVSKRSDVEVLFGGREARVYNELASYVTPLMIGEALVTAFIAFALFGYGHKRWSHVTILVLGIIVSLLSCFALPLPIYASLRLAGKAGPRISN